MGNFYVARGNAIGFGETNELAEEDLYINLCRKDIANDTKCIFTKRREELMPWNPKPNMLHLRGCGCLVYYKNKLMNTKSGKSVDITLSNVNIFYYMAELFGGELSYEDIVVVLQKELDTLFSSVIPGIKLIKDMPLIRVADSKLGFIPEQTYTFNSGIVIGVTDSMFGVKFVGDEMFYVVDKDNKYDSITNCAYICCRIGVSLTSKGVSVNGEED